MSSFDDWMPMTAVCMLGAIIHERTLAASFPDIYRAPPPEERDSLFAQAFHEKAVDFAAEQGERAQLFTTIKYKLEVTERMIGMRSIAREAFAFVGIPLPDPFLLPEIEQADSLFPVFNARLKRHLEWREPAMAVTHCFVRLLKEHQPAL